MERIVNQKDFKELPCKYLVIKFLKDLERLIFPGYFEKVCGTIDEYEIDLEKDLRNGFISLTNTDESCSNEFFTQLNGVVKMLREDIHFFYQSDPACESEDEVIITYPGLKAIFTYRVANIMYRLNIKIIPRIMSEYAHSITGIDIHPGATIASPFFIDHGTGIVIGETTIIGKNVKIYHGVTLGAKSLKDGQKLKGKKRHPTIGNNVTIYAGASILGGDTIIADNSTIGSNVFILDSHYENRK